jgi:acyl-CoA synthetase (NDP forming)
MNTHPPTSTLKPLFDPTSVAIIGASTNPQKIGGRPIAFLRKGGYRGDIFPVNPSVNEIQGLRAFRDMGEIPVPIDQAIIALPAPHVLPAFEECIARGVKAVQIFSAGFADAGDEGRALQERLHTRGAEAGVRVLGPNTLGLFNVHAGFFGTFAIGLDGAWPAPGHVGIASQSGAFGSYVFAMASDRGLGFSCFVATGNECDVDVADCISYLAQDEATRVIVTTLEGCRDGSRLRAALKLARKAAKPVIVMKVGASEAGAAAAATHTGSLAGSDAVFDAVFQECNAYRAGSIDELLDITTICANGLLPPTNQLAVLTTSGGIGVLMADEAARCDMVLPSLPEATRAQIAATWPSAAGNNPLDTTAQLIVDLSKFADLLELALAEGSIGTVVGFLAHVGRVPAHFQKLHEPLRRVRRRFPDRLIVLCMLCDSALQRELEAEGFLVFAEPGRAIRALGGAARIARGLRETHPAPLPTEEGKTLGRVGSLNELEANRLLSQGGVPMVNASPATSREQAIALARQIGFPVALKVLSPDIIHKSDVGGVLLDLVSEEQVGRGFDDVLARVRSAAPAAQLDGVLVTPMIRGGVECIMGVQRDPIFGPVVMFGLGGVLVELFRDVAFGVAPFDETEALAMIRKTRGSQLLSGFRGRPAVDINELARTLARLSQFAYAHRDEIESIDINPVLALADGVIGVDAVMHLADRQP